MPTGKKSMSFLTAGSARIAAGSRRSEVTTAVPSFSASSARPWAGTIGRIVLPCRFPPLAEVLRLPLVRGLRKITSDS
jgi:hypothetical protein